MQSASRGIGLTSKGCRAALHLKVGPIRLEVDCMKVQPFLGWRPASTTCYNKIITWANFPLCKGLRAKKLGRFNITSIEPFRFPHNPTDRVR